MAPRVLGVPPYDGAMVSNERQRNLMGAYIRQQRRLADLSMRQVSAMVGISNPYLSQIERGLRAPSEAVAAGIATALGVTVDELYEAGTEPDAPGGGPSASDGHTVLDAIKAATELTPVQRSSLAEIYRSFVLANETAAGEAAAAGEAGDAAPAT